MMKIGWDIDDFIYPCLSVYGFLTDFDENIGNNTLETVKFK